MQCSQSTSLNLGLTASVRFLASQELLPRVRAECKQMVPCSDLMLVRSLCRILEASLQAPTEVGAELTGSRAHSYRIRTRVYVR